MDQVFAENHVPKIASETESVLSLLLMASSIVFSLALARRADDHVAAGSTGDRALDRDQATLGSTRTTSRRWIDLVSAPHVTGHLLAREHAARRLALADRAGERCESELPWVASPMRKFQRLIVPWKPLPLLTPWTSTIWPGVKMSA